MPCFKILLLLTSLSVPMFACRESRPEHSLKADETVKGLGAAAIDSSLIEARMFTVSDRSNPSLAPLPRTFAVLILNQKSTDAEGQQKFTRIGFPILCPGRDPRELVKAFGDSYLDPDDAEKVIEAELNADLKLDQQPMLRCNAMPGQIQGDPLFSTVFRVIDRAAQRSYYVARFNASSPVDRKLFEIGCRETLETFWKGGSASAVPIFKESLRDVPGSDEMGALHCFSSAKALPNDVNIAMHSEPEPLVDARLYRVQDPELGNLRVVLSHGKAFKLQCSATDGTLQQAFGIEESGVLPTLTPADAAYDEFLQGRVEEQPTLRCVSPSQPPFAMDAYHVLNQGTNDPQTAASNPLLRLAYAPDALVQFECSTAARFFAGHFLNQLPSHPEWLQPVAAESTDFIVRAYVPDRLKTRAYRIGCGSALAVSEDTIRQIHREALAREPSVAELGYWKAECRKKGGACTPEGIKEQVIEATRQDKSAIRAVVFAAFQGANSLPGAVGRAPYPEELNYFIRSATNRGSHRPHYLELRGFLSGAAMLDRQALQDILGKHFGSDIFKDLNDFFTDWKFLHPSVPMSYAYLENYVLGFFVPGARDEIAKRAYEMEGLPLPKPHQSSKLSLLQAAEPKSGVFEDYVRILRANVRECLSVEATSEDGYFPMIRQHTKVSSINGRWSVNAAGMPLVGPEGYEGDAAQLDRLVMTAGLGSLLLSTRGDDSKWHDWQGWTGSYQFNSRSEIYLMINDIPQLHGDNGGALTVCLE